MNHNETFQAIARGRIIAILRGDFGGREDETACALFEGGITAVEVTLNSPGALDSIRRLAARFGNRMAVGAGTVMTPEDVQAALDAGARFVVSPNVNPAVIERTRQLGLVSLPGCFTPTEIVNALDAGADAVKLFPADSLGPGFVRAVRAPLPTVRVVPTGGVTPESARHYFDAGAWAVGVGSGLAGKASPLSEIRKQAESFAAAARP